MIPNVDLKLASLIGGMAVGLLKNGGMLELPHVTITTIIANV